MTGLDKIFKERLLKFADHLSNYSCPETEKNEFDIIISQSLIKGTDINYEYKINSWIVNEMLVCFDSWCFNEENQEPMWIESDSDGGNWVSSFIEFFGLGSETLDDMPHLLSLEGKHQNIAKYGGKILTYNSTAKDVAFNMRQFLKSLT